MAAVQNTTSVVAGFNHHHSLSGLTAALPMDSASRLPSVSLTFRQPPSGADLRILIEGPNIRDRIRGLLSVDVGAQQARVAEFVSQRNERLGQRIHDMSPQRFTRVSAALAAVLMGSALAAALAATVLGISTLSAFVPALFPAAAGLGITTGLMIWPKSFSIHPMLAQHDELPELASGLTADQFLDIVAGIEFEGVGIDGVETASLLPPEPELTRVLEARNLRLTGGWVDCNVSRLSAADALTEMEPRLAILRPHGAIPILAETTDSVHPDPLASLVDRPEFPGDDEFYDFAGKLEQVILRIGKHAFHPHVGTKIQTLEEARKLALAVPQLKFVLDTGHFFCGEALAYPDKSPADIRQAVMDFSKFLAERDQIALVHLKDVSLEKLRGLGPAASFMHAIQEGIFVEPGEGDVPLEEIIGIVFTPDTAANIGLTLEWDRIPPNSYEGVRDTIAVCFSKIHGMFAAL